MAIIPGTYFECDQCGKVWAPLKREKKLRCPNQSCRSTRWNSGKSEVPGFSYVMHPSVPKQAAVFVPESGDGSHTVEYES